MPLTQAQTATLATAVVTWFNDPTRESFRLEHADSIAEPIITALTEQLGLQSAHIEWQGVAEFGLVPIFDYHEVTDKIFAYNVHTDGTIEAFDCN